MIQFCIGQIVRIRIRDTLGRYSVQLVEISSEHITHPGSGDSLYECRIVSRGGGSASSFRCWDSKLEDYVVACDDFDAEIAPCIVWDPDADEERDAFPPHTYYDLSSAR